MPMSVNHGVLGRHEVLRQANKTAIKLGKTHILGNSNQVAVQKWFRDKKVYKEPAVFAAMRKAKRPLPKDSVFEADNRKRVDPSEEADKREQKQQKVIGELGTNLQEVEKK